MKKINILFVLPNFDTGGSEKLVFDIIQHIDKTRFAPVLCVFFSGKLEAEFLKLGVPFYVIHQDSIKPKLKVARFISDIVRRHHIEVVNTHHTSPLIQGLIPFKILNRVRWIHTEHLPLGLDPNVTSKMILLTKIWLKFVDKVVGISQGVCEYFKNELGVPERKIIKILNGVDIEKFKKRDERKERIDKRKELGIGGEDIVIGMFANFRAQKNHACLIRAFALMKQSAENGELRTEKPLRLLCVGGGAEFENIKRLCKDLNLPFADFLKNPDQCSALSTQCSVLFTGSRIDIPELMNAIDIYCLPSHFEGLPFSLIEAFAAGKIVVATDVPGNRDVIQEMGQGILVAPDNPEKLAKVLLETIEKRKEKREDRKETKDFPFSFSIMMRKYEALFSE